LKDFALVRIVVSLCESGWLPVSAREIKSRAYIEMLHISIVEMLG
jgi:hypothetical protein